MKDATLAILVIMVVAVVIGSSSLYVMNADPCLITECNATATTITVGSVTLFSGVTASNSSQAIANLFMTINNPGKTTYVSSLSLSGAWAVNNDANTTHEASTTTSEICCQYRHNHVAGCVELYQRDHFLDRLCGQRAQGKSLNPYDVLPQNLVSREHFTRGAVQLCDQLYERRVDFRLADSSVTITILFSIESL